MKFLIMWVVASLLAFAALYYVGRHIGKQPSKVDVCRELILKEVAKNQQFMDAVSPMTFNQALGGK